MLGTNLFSINDEKLNFQRRVSIFLAAKLRNNTSPTAWKIFLSLLTRKGRSVRHYNENSTLYIPKFIEEMDDFIRFSTRVRNKIYNRSSIAQYRRKNTHHFALIILCYVEGACTKSISE